MQTEIVLRNQYFMADSQGKIALILANYVTFPEILEGMEEILKADIIHELEYQRQQKQSDIRVQNSGRSDPTSMAAIRSVMIETAIHKRDIEHEIAEMQEPELYRNDLRRIEHMRQDYLVVNAFMKMLPHHEPFLIREFYHDTSLPESFCRRDPEAGIVLFPTSRMVQKCYQSEVFADSIYLQ